ncbi:MAG: hypothetical protein GF418_02950 [Chitinivibrionales bacterium]|nr:hypothetical protein [Chitinivibrionales bacterium]MBD3394560.1 hypothetical protein [Chitinivibrionales bacterium]
MNNSLKYNLLIDKYRKSMGGVFSTGDLRRLTGLQDRVLLNRRIAPLEEAGVLRRFCRGMYIAKGFSPETLSVRIIETSYLSLGTALARFLMIGSVPAGTIYAARVGRNRTFEGPGLTLEYVGIQDSLFFGYTTENAVRCATPEKALLDTLYFHLRGRRYSFNIYEDIDLSSVDMMVIDQWLSRYRNPRFVSFVRGYLNDRS